MFEAATKLQNPNLLSGNYISKLTIETLEQGVKYIQG